MHDDVDLHHGELLGGYNKNLIVLPLSARQSIRRTMLTVKGHSTHLPLCPAVHESRSAPAENLWANSNRCCVWRQTRTNPCSPICPLLWFSELRICRTGTFYILPASFKSILILPQGISRLCSTLLIQCPLYSCPQLERLPHGGNDPTPKIVTIPVSFMPCPTFLFRFWYLRGRNLLTTVRLCFRYAKMQYPRACPLVDYRIYISRSMLQALTISWRDLPSAHR